MIIHLLYFCFSPSLFFPLSSQTCQDKVVEALQQSSSGTGVKVEAPPAAPAERARALVVQVGGVVEANHLGRGVFLRGRVTSDWGDGTFDVLYESGEREVRVAEEMIQGVKEVRAAIQVPLTSYLTPHALVSRRLVSFSREQQLMPAISAHAQQVIPRPLGADRLIG